MRHPSSQHGTRRGNPLTLPTAASVGRGVLLVHLMLSPLVFTRLTTEAFESNKVALLLLSALVLAGVGLWAALSRAVGAPPDERRAAPRRVAGELLRDPLALGFLLFAASAAVSTATSISPWTSLLGANESYAGLGTTVSFVVLFFATRTLCRGVADAWRLLAACVVAAAVASAYAVLQFAHLDPMPWADVSTFAEHTRPFGSLGHANILAAYLVIVLPVVAAFAARAGSARAFGPLAVLAGFAALALAAVLLSLSRGAWLALACAGLPLPVLAWRAGRRRGVILAGAALLGAAACAAVGLGAAGRPGLWHSTAERVRHITDASTRLEIWSAGLQVFRDHPLVGTGPDTFRLAFTPKRSATYWNLEWNAMPARAHNEVVQVLATQGGLGGVALLLVLGGVAVAAVRAWRSAAPGSRALVVAAGAGVLAFCVQALFNFTLAPLGSLFVTLAALLSALGRPPAGANDGAGQGRGFAALLGTTALAGILPVILNAPEAVGSGTWWVCCGVLAVTAAAATWAMVRLGAGGERHPVPITRYSVPSTPHRFLWAGRAGIVALTALLAVLWVVRPYGAAMACRSGEVVVADGESGVTQFRRAARLAPHDEFYRVKLSEALRAVARSAAPPQRAPFLAEARRAAEEAVRLAPASAADRACLAGVLAELAALGLASADEALAEFDRAIAADPNNTCLLAEAGQAALLLGRTQAADDYFKRGTRVERHSGRLYLGLGCVALAWRHYDEAEALLAYADVGEWHGDFPARLDSCQSLALAHLACGDLADAERCAACVIQRRPDRPQPRLIRARALELLGRRDEALAEYRTARALAPDDVAARNGVRRLDAARPGNGR
jgi:O-antigen ligase/Tfp pilus assembly protein PilF